jgi:hypothetical protein
VTPLELRPLAIGELLDRVFSLYRRHLATFVGIMAIPSIFGLAMALSLRIAQYIGGPEFTGGAPFGRRPFDTPDQAFNVISIFGGAVVFIALYWVAYMLALGASAVAVSEIYAGREISISAAYASARQRTGRLLMLTLLWFLLIAGPATLLVLLSIALAIGARALFGAVWQAGVLAVLLIGLGTVGFMILSIFLSLRYALSAPALMLEGVSARVAMRRSVFLTRGYLGRVFLVGLCAAMLAYTGALLLQVPFSIASAFAGKNSPTGFWLDMVGGVFGAVGQTLTAPVMVIGVAVLYYDFRVRKEALDLQVMMTALDAGDGQPFVAPPPSPALPD